MGSRFSFLNRLNPKTEQELLEGGENALQSLGHNPEADQTAADAAAQAATKAEPTSTTMSPTQPDTSYEGGDAVAGSDAPAAHTIDPSTGSIKGVSSEPANQSYENGDPVAGQTDEAIVPRADMSPDGKTRVVNGEVVPGDSLALPNKSKLPDAEDAQIVKPDGADSEDYQNGMEMLPDTIPTKSPVTRAQLAKLGLLGGAAGAAYLAASGGGKGPPPSPASIDRSPAVDGPATPLKNNKQAPGDDAFVKQQTDGTDKTSGVKPIAPEVKGTPNSSVTSTLTPPPTDPSINTVAGLQDAQDRQNNAIFGNQLGRAGDLIGAGIAGHGATPAAQSIFNDQIKEAGNITADFAKKVEQEKNDPKSQVSQDFRDYVKQFGMTLPPTASAASAEKVMPFAFKKFEATEAQQARHEDMKYKYDALSTQKQIANQTKMQAASDKKDLEQEKAYTEANNKSLSYRSNPAVRQASADVLSVDKALALVKGKNPDDLTVQDLSLMTSELGKIAQGGVPTEHGVSQLLPNNLQSKFAQMQNFLTSRPTDAQAGEYIKHNIHYLEDMKNVANQTINDFHTATIKGYEHRISPDRYAELQQNFGLDQPAHSPITQGTSNGLHQTARGQIQSGKMAPDDNGAPGMVVPEQQRYGNAPGPATQMVHIRNKATGKVKAFTADQAAKYLKDPNFESVQ